MLEVEIEPGMKDGYQYPFIAEGKGSMRGEDSHLNLSDDPFQVSLT